MLRSALCILYRRVAHIVACRTNQVLTDFSQQGASSVISTATASWQSKRKSPRPMHEALPTLVILTVCGGRCRELSYSKNLHPSVHPSIVRGNPRRTMWKNSHKMFRRVFPVCLLMSTSTRISCRFSLPNTTPSLYQSSLSFHAPPLHHCCLSARPYVQMLH